MPFALIPSNLKIWMATSFPSSKGARYPFALEIARGADYYREDPVGKGTVHVAGWRFERESMLKAIVLLEYAGGLRGCMTSNGSSVWSSGRTLRVLRCILQAMDSGKPSAFCQVPYESLRRVLRFGATPAVLPCRLIETYFIKNWHTEENIPDQLRAAAVESGCEWCPLFTPQLREFIPQTNNPTTKLSIQ